MHILVYSSVEKGEPTEDVSDAQDVSERASEVRGAGQKRECLKEGFRIP